MHELYGQILDKLGAYESSEPPTISGADEPTVVVEMADGEEEPEAPKGQEKVSNVTAINLFRNPEAHPIVLDLALLSKYGIDWLDWETETLELRIPQDFKTSSISDLNLEKLQACRTLHLVDSYWQRWEIFLPCTLALSGTVPDFRVMQIPTVAQCLISTYCASKIRDDVPFSDEIAIYVGVVHRYDEILCPQPPLDFAKVDSEGLPVDCEEISRLWPEVRMTRKIPSIGPISQEQLKRMLLVYDYLEDSRRDLQSQLSFLTNV